MTLHVVQYIYVLLFRFEFYSRLSNGYTEEFTNNWKGDAGKDRDDYNYASSLHNNLTHLPGRHGCHDNNYYTKLPIKENIGI